MQDAPNYQWWRENGSSWMSEVAELRSHMPIYYLQQTLLAEIIERNAPGKVLEFGCGFGRHMKCLSQIDGIDVHGYDQSHTMVDGMLEWCSPEWMKDHVTIGAPLNPLPFPDQSFDVTFTVSVLIHIRPEHIEFILSELRRVTRNRIIHFENLAVSESKESSDAHDGCWMHPIQAIYRKLGESCEVLPRPFEIQDAYIVTKDECKTPLNISRALLENMRNLDRELTQRVTKRDQTIDRLKSQLLRLRGEVTALSERTKDAIRLRDEEIISLRSRISQENA